MWAAACSLCVSLGSFLFSYNTMLCCINSSPPSAAYMHQWTGSSLVQVMACHLFVAKPLPEPMLVYCLLHSLELISVKFEFEFYPFHSRQCIWKCHLPKWQPLCPGGDESVYHLWSMSCMIWCSPVLTIMSCILSNLWYKAHQIPKLKCFSSHLAAVFVQSIEARC